MNFFQEKFQVIAPAKPEGGEPWVSADSQRDLRGLKEFVPATAESVDPQRFNQMPPGMDIGDQKFKEKNDLPFSMAGATDVSDTTTDAGFRNGFVKQQMKGCDDQYTGEHVDHFYGDAGGFAERNNYLDRM